MPVRSGRVKGWIARSTFLPILLLAISKSYCVCRFCHSWRTRSEVPGTTAVHLSRNRPSTSHYLIDRWCGHAEFLCHPVRAQLQGCMKSWSRISPG